MDCLRRHRTINASLDGDNIIYRSDINLGIAVALENGLIVPVVKARREEHARAVESDPGYRRARALEKAQSRRGAGRHVHDYHPATSGTIRAADHHQPQVAILGVGAIEKRPVVVDDAIGIR